MRRQPKQPTFIQLRQHVFARMSNQTRKLTKMMRRQKKPLRMLSLLSSLARCVSKTLKTRNGLPSYCSASTRKKLLQVKKKTPKIKKWPRWRKMPSRNS